MFILLYIRLSYFHDKALLFLSRTVFLEVVLLNLLKLLLNIKLLIYTYKTDVGNTSMNSTSY